MLSSVPRLTQLRLLRTADGGKIEIINTIASDWTTVGDFLDFDPAGAKLKQIKADEKGVEACCRAMFQFWLEGNGVKPVSWATLVTVLRDSKLCALADQVKKHLQK